LIKTIRLIYLTNTLKSRDSRSLMHAENSYEMPKYFTHTTKIQLFNSLMVCMILFMYVSLKTIIFCLVDYLMWW